MQHLYGRVLTLLYNGLFLLGVMQRAVWVATNFGLVLAVFANGMRGCFVSHARKCCAASLGVGTGRCNVRVRQGSPSLQVLLQKDWR